MTFSDLKDFLIQKMRMSHIYQPLLIKALLESGGLATIRQLAVSFASQDESQIIYYEKRLKEIPIKVLSSHDIIQLTLEQKAELLQICGDKINQYIASKGLAI